MSILFRSYLLVAAIAALTACGSKPPEDSATEAERQQALRESAFGSMVEQMDRAAEVQQLELDRKREIDEALDQ